MRSIKLSGKLTDAKVKALVAKDGKYTFFRESADYGLRGFGVVVAPKTGSKNFYVQRKFSGAKDQRRKLGEFPLVSTREARGRAENWVRLASDPNLQIASLLPNEGKDTLRIALENFLNSRRVKGISETTIKSYDLAVNAHLSDWLARDLSTITVDELEARLLEIRNRVMEKWKDRSFKNGSPYQGNYMANLTIKTFGFIFKFAKRNNRSLPDNPVQFITFLPTGQREDYIVASDLPRFVAAVRSYKAQNPFVSTLVELLLLTGMRIGEASALHWNWLNFEEKLVVIPQEYVKNRKGFRVPMSAPVHRLLLNHKQLYRTTSEFVFPSPDSRSGHVENNRAAFKAIHVHSGVVTTPNNKAPTAHTLRHTVATFAQDQLGYSEKEVMGILNHRSNTPTSIYMHGLRSLRTFFGELGDAMETATMVKSPNCDAHHSLSPSPATSYP